MKDTFNDFPEELLSADNFLMKRKVDGESWAAPLWAHCMVCELQLGREAMKLCPRERPLDPAGVMVSVPQPRTSDDALGYAVNYREQPKRECVRQNT